MLEHAWVLGVKLENLGLWRWKDFPPKRGEGKGHLPKIGLFLEDFREVGEISYFTRIWTNTFSWAWAWVVWSLSSFWIPVCHSWFMSNQGRIPCGKGGGAGRHNKYKTGNIWCNSWSITRKRTMDFAIASEDRKKRTLVLMRQLCRFCMTNREDSWSEALRWTTNDHFCPLAHQFATNLRTASLAPRFCATSQIV